MESFFSRYRNELVLIGVLFIESIILASNVERNDPRAQSPGRVSLIRVWTVNAITPAERLFVSTGHFFRNTWRSYVDLHDVRTENRRLQEELDQLRTEQSRLRENVSDVRRLKALLDFKERYIGKTVAAQVIGTTGSDQSRAIYIDKGSRAGLRPDMAVITPDGIVGKVKEVFEFSSQVLMISDHDSAAGVILEKSRLQGILHGTGLMELTVSDIMADENVESGEHVITSGGDRIYPKGLPVGTIISALPDHDNAPFMAIRVKPAADLARLEEVLVVVSIAEEKPVMPEGGGRIRAADILSQRLPTVPKVGTPGTDANPAINGKKRPPARDAGEPASPGSARPSTPKKPAGPEGSVPQVETPGTDAKLPVPAAVNGKKRPPAGAVGEPAGAGPARPSTPKKPAGPEGSVPPPKSATEPPPK